jgi:hypothetical protein
MGVAWNKVQTCNAQGGIAVCGMEDWIRENLLTQANVSLQ